jgi:glycosyltransferase involved in cell wall biosynthesis
MKITYIFNREVTSEKASLVQAVHMCDAFASNGVDVEMACPRNRTKVSEDFLFSRFGIEHNVKLSFYSKIKFFRRFGIIGSYFGIKKFLLKSYADVYFTRCPMIFTILVNRKLPVIYEAHNAKIHIGSELYNRFWINNVIKASQSDNCLAFITISENLGNYYAKIGVPLNKILSLHDGFNRDMFKGDVSKMLARSELGLSPWKKVITYTGSLYQDRGIENIIKLAGRFPEGLFVVVGGPQSNAEYYKSLCGKSAVPNIKFTGPVDHSKIPLFLYASDVLLALWSDKVPTIEYCSPLKVFEYMASGRIILAHSFPTIKEVIKHEVNGLLVEPDDFEDLVSKTKLALNDLALDKLGKTAREEAFKRYSWNIRAKEILKQLE